jgi:hypothetical protein
VSVVVVAYLFPNVSVKDTLVFTADLAVCLVKGIQHYFTAGET